MTRLLRAFGKARRLRPERRGDHAIQRGDIPRRDGNCPCDHYSGWLLAP